MSCRNIAIALKILSGATDSATLANVSYDFQFRAVADNFFIVGKLRQQLCCGLA